LGRSKLRSPPTKIKLPGIILEPVPGNAAYICHARLPRISARNHQDKGDGMIFDEVMTGFRLAKGGAQERFGITRI